jgi:hypothetical protein
VIAVDGKSNSFSNGPNSSNGPLVKVRHGWDCVCIWCLQGHK